VQRRHREIARISHAAAFMHAVLIANANAHTLRSAGNADDILGRSAVTGLTEGQVRKFTTGSSLRRCARGAMALSLSARTEPDAGLRSVVRPEVTQSYAAAELCRAGSNVEMLVLPDIGHGRAAQASTRAAVNWRCDRFTEAQPPNTSGVPGNAR
jgi:hypothetical protein